MINEEPIVYLSCVDLTPGLTNPYSSNTFHPILNVLRADFKNWEGFFKKYPGYGFGIIIATKKENTELNVKGPSVSKKYKIVDFVIYLPIPLGDIDNYIENVFLALSSILSAYNIPKEYILELGKQVKL